ncbi:MAG: hypothetical protein ACKOTF_13575 [Opitutaceae bacterium]
MNLRPVRLLILLVVLPLGGCTGVFRETTPPAPAQEPLAPSPRLIVGRIIALDPERGFAMIELAADAPPAALADGGELVARTLADLRETARLLASRYVRGRTLGATVKSGMPTVGDEVVWSAP